MAEAKEEESALVPTEAKEEYEEEEEEEYEEEEEPEADEGEDDEEDGEFEDEGNDDQVNEMHESKYTDQHEQKYQEGSEDLPSELTDPKVMEFLKILDEYRLKCESEGNYSEAERASKQLDNLRKQEIKRQNKALKARQLSERQSIQMAHNLQFSEFNSAWDTYMKEFDDMSAQYIQQMTTRHAEELRKFQEEIHAKVAAKQPKFSRELLEWRRREQIMAKQKDYAQAQKIKAIADKMEAKERSKIDSEFQNSFASKESRFRAQQQAELNALLKRIEVRRKEHLAQRNLDSKRLLQRNRNVQAVLESKQVSEERIAKSEIKSRLSRPRNPSLALTLSSSSGTKSNPSKKSHKANRAPAIEDEEPYSPKPPGALSPSTFLTG